MSLHHRAGELGQRKDLHVLPRGARAGDLRARRVVHLQGAAAAGEPGRGELPEPEAEHAHRDSAQEDADQVEGDVGQVGSGSAPLSFAWFSCICLNWDGVDRSDRLLEQCSIALVGKYTKFSDSYASVIKALEHSALAISHKLEVKVCAQYGACVQLLGLDASQTGSKQHLSSSVHRLGVSGAKHLAGGAGEVPRGVAEALQLRVSAEPLLLPVVVGTAAARSLTCVLVPPLPSAASWFREASVSEGPKGRFTPSAGPGSRENLF